MRIVDHDQAKLHLSDLIHGDLDEPLQAKVLVHVQGCADCAQLRNSYAILRTGIPESERNHREHPSSTELVDHAFDPGRFSGGAGAGILRHLRQCASCTGEWRAVKGAVRHSARKDLIRMIFTLREPLWTPMRTALATAVVVIVLLGYPSFLGLVRLPQLVDDARRSARTDSQQWEGPAEWLLVEGTTRETHGPLSVELNRSQPYVLLALQPDLPQDARASASYRVEIRDASGRSVWSTDLRASEIDDSLRRFDVVVLPVPVANLSAGLHELTMRSLTEPDVPPLLETSIRIQP